MLGATGLQKTHLVHRGGVALHAVKSGHERSLVPDAARAHATATGDLGRQQPRRETALAGPNGRGWLGPVIIGSVRTIDCLIVLIAGLLAHITAVGFQLPGLSLLLIAVLISSQTFAVAGLYLNVPDANRLCLTRLIGAWTAVLLVVAPIVADQGYVFYGWMGLWFLYGSVGLCAARVLFAYKVRRWRRQSYLSSNIVIVGDDDLPHRLADHLQKTADSRVHLIGVFCDSKDAQSKNSIRYTPNDFDRFARSNRIDQVIVAFPWHAQERAASWVKHLRTLAVDVLLCPVVHDGSFSEGSWTHLNGVPLLKVAQRPLFGWSYVVKAVEDRLLAFLLLIFLGPLMLLIALLVLLDSRGPVLFRQQRHGFNNSVIEVLKFRTMFAEAAELGAGSVKQATRNDPRVTRVGHWLRRTSLDELPQLFNVLRGQMSLVGPRPHALAHNELYANLIDEYMARHRVKPGITGWAQVNGFRGETDTREKMEGRIRCDLYYIDHWSLLLDLRILARTLLVGFVHRNAY